MGVAKPITLCLGSILYRPSGADELLQFLLGNNEDLRLA